MAEIDIFLERFDLLAGERGKSERGVSLDATGSVDRIRNARRNRALPKRDTLEQLSAYFGVSIDYLLGRSDVRGMADAPLSPPREAVVSDRRVAWRDPGGRMDLPILGTALGHSFFDDGETEAEIEQTIFEPGEPVRFLGRPAALNADPHAYAVYIQGDSMSPRYEQGELAVVTTRKPPQIGDDVIVQLIGSSGNGEDDAPIVSVLIKRLVRRSASWIELRQFNPNVSFRVPTSRVRHLHRITPIGDLLGA